MWVLEQKETTRRTSYHNQPLGVSRISFQAISNVKLKTMIQRISNGLELYYDLVERMLTSLMTADYGGFEANLVLLSVLALDREYCERLLIDSPKVLMVLSLAISESISRYAKMISFKILLTLGGMDDKAAE